MNVTEQKPPAPPNEVDSEESDDGDSGHECPNCGSPHTFVKLVETEVDLPVADSDGGMKGR